MEVTETKIFLKDSVDKKLKAYVTVTFDNVFVVRNIKIIEGSKGFFIAMPARKIKHPCSKCGYKNDSRSRYCNQCGSQLPAAYSLDASPDASLGLSPEQKDIAHPITQSFRDYLQKKIFEAYEQQKLSSFPSLTTAE